MLREDYVMRLIRQAAAAIRRMIDREKAGDVSGALEEAQRAYEELLGMPPGLSDVIDSANLATLLARPEKMRVAARVSWQEGHLYKAKGDPLTAFNRYRRAHELYLEARARDPEPDDDAAILELSRLVPASELDERFRS